VAVVAVGTRAPCSAPEVLAMPDAVVQGLRGQRDEGKQQYEDQVRPSGVIH